MFTRNTFLQTELSIHDNMFELYFTCRKNKSIQFSNTPGIG